MLLYILLGLVLVLLICVIYWTCFYDLDKQRRKCAADHVNASIGTYDADAQAAMNELNNIQNMTAEDRFRRGNVMRFNVLGGETNLRGLSPAERNRRRRAVGTVIRDYNDAINVMGARAAHRDTNANGANNRVYRINFGDVAADLMIQTIAHFGREIAADADIADDYEYAQLIQILNDNVNTVRPVVQRETRETRKAEAVAAADNPADVVGTYFDNATTYTSNGQNVHESKVNGDLRAILRKLKLNTTVTLDSGKSISEARSYIRNYYQHEHPNKVKDAISGLDRAARGEYISTFDDTEDRIFAYVWDRSNHPRNVDNSDLMKEALLNALADGMENGSQVCINGRCARILGSMTTLDFDYDVANGVMTFEAYRNQIFQETKDIFDQEYERVSNSDDPNDKSISEYLSGANDNVDRSTVDRFINGIKVIVDKNIARYKDKFNSDELEAIRGECYTAVEI